MIWPQQEATNSSAKNLATIISAGPEEHAFAICFLHDKEEQALVFSPEDGSYDVKQNVGKDIIHTGVRPAMKGQRKWLCDGILLRLMPEDLAGEIITPNQTQKSNFETTLSDKPKSSGKASMSVNGFKLDYIDKVAAAQGYSGRLARTSALSDILGYCNAHNILIND